MSSAADPVKTTTWKSGIRKQAGPAKDHEHHKMDLQNFIRGRSSQDHQPGFFLLAAAWVDPGRTPFSQLNKGVKDAIVVSTELVIRQVRMTKTCKKAIFDKQQQSTPKTTNLAIWSRNSVIGRPNKDYAPHKMRFQNFVRGRSSQDHKPGNLEYENSRQV